MTLFRPLLALQLLIFFPSVFCQSTLSEVEFKTSFLALMDSQNLKIFSAYAKGSNVFINKLIKSNQTLLIPQDKAWSSLIPAQIGSLDYINDLVDYHTLQISPPFFSATSNTIVKSQLIDQKLVNLPNQTPQVLVLNSTTPNFNILQPNSLIKANSSFQFDNTFILIIPTLLEFPKNISTVLIEQELPTIVENIDNANLDFQSLLKNGSGLTIFAPSEQAWLDYYGPTSVTPLTLPDLPNHFILNDQVGYSDSRRTFTTLGKKVISAFGNELGRFIVLEGIVAKILKEDILTSSGVIHIIDTVLSPPLPLPPPPPASTSQSQSFTPLPSPTISSFVTTSLVPTPSKVLTLSLRPNIYPPVVSYSSARKERIGGSLVVVVLVFWVW